jgi:magnesium-transporting ATPase (P-type)
VIVLDKNKVIANPGDFMQALIIASTTLMAFTGVFLSSSMFSDYRAYKDKVASTSRRFFILSIVMGLITIVFLLSWYLGWVIDPILDAKTATPKMVLVLFFGQFVTVWVGFIWKFLQKSKYA